MASYTLSNGEDLNRKNPDSFGIPPRKQRESLKVGSTVKLIFDNKERMWVNITERTESGYRGTLSNIPAGIRTIQQGDMVDFAPENIIDIFGREQLSSVEDIMMKELREKGLAR